MKPDILLKKIIQEAVQDATLETVLLNIDGIPTEKVVREYEDEYVVFTDGSTMSYGDFENVKLSDDEISEEDYLIQSLYDFLLLIDPDENKLSEEATYLYHEMMDYFDEFLADEVETDIELDEAAKRVRRVKKADYMRRRKEYRRKKAQVKRKQAMYRRTAKYKQYKRKAERMSKIGRTTSGKRMSRLKRV